MNTQQDSTIDQPAGFCPYCDYAIDPGRCPECGRDVTPDRLVTSPKRARRIRLIRRAFKFLVIAIAIGGLGYGVYHETRPHRWVRYCSTDYLLRVEESGGNLVSTSYRSTHNIYNELYRRFRKSNLSESQFKSWLKLYTTYYFEPPTILSPRPVGAISEWNGVADSCFQLVGLLELYSRFPDEFAQILYSDELWVDNKLHTSIISKTRFNRAEILGRGLDEEFRFAASLVSQLAPGKYTLEFRRVVRFEEKVFIGNTNADPEYSNYLPVEIEYVSKQDVEIQLRDIMEFTTPVFDDETIDRLETEGLFEDPVNFNQEFRLNPESIPQIAGYCLVYPNDESRGNVDLCVFRIPQDCCRLPNIMARCLSNFGRVRVEIIPSAELAFDAGYTEYFNGVIKWNDIDIRFGSMRFGQPDSIEPYDGE